MILKTKLENGLADVALCIRTRVSVFRVSRVFR